MRDHLTLEELKIKLSREELIKDKYSIAHASDNKYCVVCENKEWSTFYYEKGQRTRLKRYAAEPEACAAFYECMMTVKERLLKGYNSNEVK